MSKSIFLRNRKRPDVANRIMSNMNDHDNPDMDVNFKGYMHGGKGFLLEVTNMESVKEYTLDAWKHVVKMNGYVPTVVTDMLSGKVSVECYPEEKRRSYVSSLVYLSIMVGLIYLLWMRQQSP